MGVYKKDNRWYIDYYLPNGQRKREVVNIEGVDPSRINREDAKKALSIRKAEIAQGKFDIERTSTPILFDKLIEQYLEFSKSTKKPNSYNRDITSYKHLIRYFKGKIIQKVSAWQVEKYKSYRQKEAMKNGKYPSKITINRELAMLKHMFNKAVEWNLLSNNPIARVKLFPEKPKQLRVITEAEFKKLYNEASEFLKPILMIAVHAGLRRSEILNLNKSDINLKDRYILVRESKNGEIRHVPINSLLMKTLKSVINNNDSEYLFPGPKGDPVKSVKQGFWAALRRSGIAHLRFHDLRHSFGSNLSMAGVDIATIQELMGHKDISTTKRYLHPSPSHKKEAVERLKFSPMDTYLDTKSDMSETHISITNRNN
ncbi:MAG: tyrosine-type recombinase/integrase [Candidatus Dadabacteria bacterium]|nr:tyrosine-type recombinase/integrase [Candidatus Dadabacteria bacterium]NIQ15583.1 tyrosine-type recombinase/integrase [Candidatus Dadabacteria bacterium]